MKVLKNITLEHTGKAFQIDIFEAADTSRWLVFCHGIKGAKDWGAWHDMAAYIMEHSGISVVAMNFAFNGIGLDGTTNFQEPEAFGLNNYSKEIADIKIVISYLKSVYEVKELNLMGHSRGGGLALVFAATQHEVHSVIGLASVRRLDYAWLEDGFVQKWQAEGQYKVYNSREKIYLPIYFQMYEDFDQHRDAYLIDNAAQKLKNTKILLIHGTADEAVSIEQARELFKLLPHAQILEIESANHTFEISHPWNEPAFSAHFQQAVEAVSTFLKR